MEIQEDNTAEEVQLVIKRLRAINHRLTNYLTPFNNLESVSANLELDEKAEKDFATFIECRDECFLLIKQSQEVVAILSKLENVPTDFTY